MRRWLPFAFFAAAAGLADVARADVCDPRGVLTPSVVHLLGLCAQQLGEKAPGVWDLPAAHAFADRHFARPVNAERLSPLARDQYRRLTSRFSRRQLQAMQNDLAAAGFMNAVAPPAVPIDYVLLNGSVATSVRARIAAVAQAVEDGHLTLREETQIVFLDGERPLFAAETADALRHAHPYAAEPGWQAPAELPQDERGMDEMLWAQMRLPKAMRERGALFVHADKQPGAARAHTADCMRTWVQRHHPRAGTALVVSNNPFIEYQRRVTEVLLAQSGSAPMHVVAMGPGADIGAFDLNLRLGFLLDALAGTLHRAEQQRQLGAFAPQNPVHP